ncbi:30S ribosomal protein S4 [bacterium]|nr:30S ribosomal protein S4 [bacterium]
MAKLRGPVCKYCRKYGIKLYLKGRKCESDKCPIDPRRGRTRIIRQKKTSEYGLQLREKNKVKVFYGVLERQFKRYFELAKKQKGVAGENLLQFLERRLDNVVYKAKWAVSRRMAKQMINHGAILVNGRKVDRPGYLVEIGDIIQVKPTSKYVKIAKEIVEESKDKMVPSWMKPDEENLKVEILRYPTREEVSIPVDEQLIVNLYSK